MLQPWTQRLSRDADAGPSPAESTLPPELAVLASGAGLSNGNGASRNGSPVGDAGPVGRLEDR